MAQLTELAGPNIDIPYDWHQRYTRRLASIDEIAVLRQARDLGLIRVLPELVCCIEEYLK
jgi:hypothetical protein